MDTDLIGLIALALIFVVAMIGVIAISWGSWKEWKAEKAQKGQNPPVTYYGGAGKFLQSVKDALGFYDNEPPKQPDYNFYDPIGDLNRDKLNTQ